MYIKLTRICRNMLQIPKTHKYYLLKVTKFPISPKMMRSATIHWLWGERITTKVLVRIPMGTVVTHYQNLIMIMLFLRLRIVFFTQ